MNSKPPPLINAAEHSFCKIEAQRSVFLYNKMVCDDFR